MAEDKNPNVIACEGKAAGDTCTAVRMIKSNEGQPVKRESPGQCATDECCELDYSKGSPPETVCGACLACKAGAPTPTPDAPDVTAPSTADAGSQADAAAAQPSSDPPATSPNDKRGCSVGGSGRGGATWQWLPLMLLAWRRRAS